MLYLQRPDQLDKVESIRKRVTQKKVGIFITVCACVIVEIFIYIWLIFLTINIHMLIQYSMITGISRGHVENSCPVTTGWCQNRHEPAA